MASEVQRLKVAGRYAEAADLLQKEGDPAAAARLLAEVWDFSGALRIARDAGLLLDAYRYAVEANDADACVALRTSMQDGIADAELRKLALFAERRGRLEDAAYFLLWSDEALGSAKQFAAAGRPLMAARLLVMRGRAKEAAELLARAHALEASPELTLALAQALLALGRYQRAIDVVQSAPLPESLRVRQQELVAEGLRGLGLRSAADGIDAQLNSRSMSALQGVRYLALGASGQLYDRWLRRSCCEEFEIGPSRHAQLLSYAKVVHPNSQMVYWVSENHALLEKPAGVSLRGASNGEYPLSRATVFEQLESALRALHATGLAHGAVDEDHVCVSAQRLVLLIPPSPMPSATAAQDRKALEGLRKRQLTFERA